jgi:hypothetical protein
MRFSSWSRPELTMVYRLICREVDVDLCRSCPEGLVVLLLPETGYDVALVLSTCHAAIYR